VGTDPPACFQARERGGLGLCRARLGELGLGQPRPGRLFGDCLADEVLRGGGLRVTLPFPGILRLPRRAARPRFSLGGKCWRAHVRSTSRVNNFVRWPVFGFTDPSVSFKAAGATSRPSGHGGSWMKNSQ